MKFLLEMANVVGNHVTAASELFWIFRSSDFMKFDFTNDKKSRNYKRLFFLSKPFMMSMWNQGSKENLGVKFKEDICVKLCLKLWFKRGWGFCNINNSEWFWKRLSRRKGLNNHFLKSLQKQPYADVLQNKCS